MDINMRGGKIHLSLLLANDEERRGISRRERERGEERGGGEDIGGGGR